MGFASFKIGSELSESVPLENVRRGVASHTRKEHKVVAL